MTVEWTRKQSMTPDGRAELETVDSGLDSETMDIHLDGRVEPDTWNNRAIGRVVRWCRQSSELVVLKVCVTGF